MKTLSALLVLAALFAACSSPTPDPQAAAGASSGAGGGPECVFTYDPVTGAENQDCPIPPVPACASSFCGADQKCHVHDYPSGTECGPFGVCDGLGACDVPLLPCTSADQCPVPANPCMAPTCMETMCSAAPVPDGNYCALPGGSKGLCLSSACVATASPCAGCLDTGKVCQDGYSLDACGSNGAACAACSTGETCTSGACAAYASTCLAKLQAGGALGAACADDAACGAGSWCQAACCDPVTHVCTAIRECRGKLAAGEPCDHVGGDHECASGTCDTMTDTCL